MRAACACLLAVLALTPAGGATPSASPSPAVLLARHVPILVLHPAEPLRPVAVDGFLAGSDLQRRGPSGAWEKVGGPPPVGGPDLRLDQRSCRAIEGIAATPCYVAAQAPHGTSPVVYGAAFRKGSRIDLQYWIWYPWNPYSPTVPAGDLWLAHEGDWEAVSVIVDSAGHPLVAGYSQHEKGVRREWAKVPKRGLRPLVYVALGSHANYFAPGTHRFDPRVQNALLISVIRQAGHQPVDHAGRGAVVRPRLVRVSARTPVWMTFAGKWGEDSYLHVPGGVPSAYSSGGPTGPAFHQQWRRPVATVLSWPRA